MTTSFQSLLSACLVALGDSTGAMWSRTDVIWPWCIEAMLAFPILRPMQDTPSTAAATHVITLPSDFREIISVEYPVGQEPPVYLSRRNSFDPNFYSSDEYYDIDRNYASATGWVLVFSKKLLIDSDVVVNYLAIHDTDLDDASDSYITVPDEYVNILVAYMLAKGYRERLWVPTCRIPLAT
jgi:hypothetical protein